MSSGCGEKWLDPGYVLKAEPLGFMNGLQHSSLNCS